MSCACTTVQTYQFGESGREWEECERQQQTTNKNENENERTKKIKQEEKKNNLPL